jgi:hypothetical protein
VQYGIERKEGVDIMAKYSAVIGEEDGYIAIKWSEYKELLITKGRYEELVKKPTVEYVPYNPNIQPLITPYDTTPTVTFSNVERDKDGNLVEVK